MTFVTSDIVPSRFGLHSRIALALGHAAIDAQTQQEFFAASVSGLQNVDYVDDLIKAGAKSWTDYIEHPFPQQLANDTASLNGFRHYMVQDALYLEHYYRFRTEAVAKRGTFDEIKGVAGKLAKSLDWVSSFRGDLTNKLGVPKNKVTGPDCEPESTALKESIKLHEGVLSVSGDLGWLDVHIVLLPCILGYDTIASKLLYDPQTIRNTIYYPLWIQANVGGSSVKEYRDFINKSIASLAPDVREKKWGDWVKIFTEACGTEKRFFDLGIPSSPDNTVPAYNVVNDETYKIRNYGNTHYLVSNADSSVTTKVLQGDEGKWKLTNATNVGGYTIESVSGKKGFLKVSVGDLTEPTYPVTVSEDGTKLEWPINPVVVYNDKGALTVLQIFVPGKTHFVVDAGRKEKVFVANNSQISSQLWLLEPA